MSAEVPEASLEFRSDIIVGAYFQARQSVVAIGHRMVILKREGIVRTFGS